MKKYIRIIGYILLTACLMIACYFGYKVFISEVQARKDNKRTVTLLTESEIPETVTEDTTEEPFSFDKEKWQIFKAENNDFVGYLQFNSGIISTPVVMTGDNTYYLNHNFCKSKDWRGCSYVDCVQGVSDNITIYGHNITGNTTLLFSPLKLLKLQSYYDANKYITLYLENTVNQYEVCYVYELTYKMAQTYDYTQSDFSKNEWNDFITVPEQNNLIASDTRLEYGNAFMTLQTCIDNSDDKRLIVVAKCISISDYPE